MNSKSSQTLIDLSSVEDDGFGDDLNVIWEVEPGARVLETATLPRPTPGRFDDPERLDAFLDAVRWGAIQSADSRALQAPFRSGITIEDYQLDPVVRALQAPRVNLLIADDVGLGKTIEAGLVIQELLLRHRARTVMIVCPASLCLKGRRKWPRNSDWSSTSWTLRPFETFGASGAWAPTSGATSHGTSSPLTG